MSSTSYHTSAKPRGRRGSLGEASDKHSRSRASSSFSAKSPKVSSRDRDHASSPRLSRPSTPGTHYLRQKPVAPRSSDALYPAQKKSVDSIRSDKSSRSRLVTQDGDSRGLEFANKAISTTLEADHVPAKAPAPHPSRSPPVAPAKTGIEVGDAILPPAIRFSAGSQEAKLNPAGTAPSLQPTVAEDVDDSMPTDPSSLAAVVRPPSPLAPSQGTDQPQSASEHSLMPVSHEPNLLSIDSTGEGAPKFKADDTVKPLANPTDPAAISAMPPPPPAFDAQTPVTVMRMTESIPPLSHPPPTMPATFTPLVSPPTSPMLHQYMEAPPPQSAQRAYSRARGSPTPYQPFFQHPWSTPPLHLGFPESIPRTLYEGSEDERARLLAKISNVLPDIKQLLYYYQESQGLLTEKDFLVKQAETLREEEVTRLRIELCATKEEYERIIGQQAAENFGLKSQVAQHVDRIAALERACLDAAKIQDEVAALRDKHGALERELEVAHTSNELYRNEKQHLQTTMDSVQQERAEEQGQHDGEVCRLVQTHEDDLSAKDRDHSKEMADQKVGLSKVQLDLAAMIAKHVQQRKDLESARASVSGHAQTLAETQKQLADAVLRHKAELESQSQLFDRQVESHAREIERCSTDLADATARHDTEKARMKQEHDDTIEKMHRDAEARSAEIMLSHERRVAELQTSVEKLRAEMEIANSRLSDEKSAHEKLRTEMELANSQLCDERIAHDKLKQDATSEREAHSALRSLHDAATNHHATLAESFVSLKNKHAEVQLASEKIAQTLRSLEQLGTASTFSRGDQFYVSAFCQLASSVADISTQFFEDGSVEVAYLMSILPAHVTRWHFAGESMAARGLRSLFIQRQIWDILHRHIFEAFLFGDADDTLESGDFSLSTVSRLIRNKSVRRERQWRVVAVRAILASSLGRRAVVIAARRASREILDRIGPLTSTDHHAPLHQAVWEVTKAAVRVWRRLRLEADLTSSNMPPIHPKSHDFAGANDILFWVRPHVVKEKLVKLPDPDPRMGLSTSIEECIYLQGNALRRDSALLSERRADVIVE